MAAMGAAVRPRAWLALWALLLALAAVERPVTEARGSRKMRHAMREAKAADPAAQQRAPARQRPRLRICFCARDNFVGSAGARGCWRWGRAARRPRSPCTAQ